MSGDFEIEIDGKRWRWNRSGGFGGWECIGKSWEKEISEVKSREDVIISKSGNGAGVCLCKDGDSDSCSLKGFCLLGKCKGFEKEGFIDLATPIGVEKSVGGKSFNELCAELDNGALEVRKKLKDVKKTLGDDKTSVDSLLNRRAQEIASTVVEGGISPEQKTETGSVGISHGAGQGIVGQYIPKVSAEQLKKEETLERDMAFACSQLVGSKASGLWQKPLFKGEK